MSGCVPNVNSWQFETIKSFVKSDVRLFKYIINNNLFFQYLFIKDELCRCCFFSGEIYLRFCRYPLTDLRFKLLIQYVFKLTAERWSMSFRKLWQQQKVAIPTEPKAPCDLITVRKGNVLLKHVMYLIGSCECISMGRGVPPIPPRVRASMKPRTTAHLRAVPNSSRVYLTKTEEKESRVKKTAAAVFSCRLSVGGQSVTQSTMQEAFPKGEALRVFWLFGGGRLCDRLNRRLSWNLSLNITRLSMTVNWDRCMFREDRQTGRTRGWNKTS